MPSRRLSVGVRSTPASKYFRQSLANPRTPLHGAGRARTPGKTPSKNVSGGGTGGSVKVVVRVRPENKKEQQLNYKIIVKAMDQQCVVFDPKEEEIPDFYQGQRRTGRDLLKKESKDMKFAFDRVFDYQASNEEVYNETTKTVLDGLLDGYNCSVFAYGATGAGKTFTMLGTPTQPGVMFLTMMDLYQRMEAMKDTKVCEVAISYLEVYNEQIKDLLHPSGYLPVREDPQNGVIVSGLTLHKPRSAEELLHMLDSGNKNRSQHPTDANAESSRSHAVFQVFIRQKERTANISTEVKVAKMSLIDLAGSERATATKNMGKRFREGANINRSLLALGNCINALAEGKSRAFVPYRDSKLTRLLKDSLGGNCRTLMIAAVSPSGMTYEDTYNTLKYANRAKNIKVELKSNVMNVDFHVTRYQQIVEELRGEITELKEKLEKSEQATKSSTADDVSVSLPFMQELERLQTSVYDVFDQRVFTRKELMEYESSEKELTYKMHSKRCCLNRLNIVSDSSHDKEKVIAKYKRFIERSEKRVDTVKQRKLSAEERMSNNTALLQKIEKDLETSHVVKNDLASQNLALSLRCRHLEVELRDTKRQVQFLKKLCRHHGRELHTTDKLDSTLLKTVQKQYYLMQASGLATSDVVADYEAIVREVEGEREVAWADQSVLDMTLGLESNMADASSENGLDYNLLLDFPVLHEVTFTPPKKSVIVPLSANEENNPSIPSRVLSEVLATPGIPVATPGPNEKNTLGLYTPGVCAATPLDSSTPGDHLNGAGATPGQPCPNSNEHSSARRALADTIYNTVEQCSTGDQVHKPVTNNKKQGLNSTFTMEGVEPLPISPSSSECSDEGTSTGPQPRTNGIKSKPVGTSECKYPVPKPRTNVVKSKHVDPSDTYTLQSSTMHLVRPLVYEPKTMLQPVQEHNHPVIEVQSKPHVTNSLTQSGVNKQQPLQHQSQEKQKSSQHNQRPQHPATTEPSQPRPKPAPRHVPLDTTITLEPGESLADSPLTEKREAGAPKSAVSETKNKTVTLPSTPQRISPSADYPALGNSDKPHYRRVMDFQQENLHTPPASKLTFADVVKSPAVAKPQPFNKQISDLKMPETPRSPLAPRGNLPDVTPNSNRKKDKDSGSSSMKKFAKLSNKKYKLPSVIESINKLRRAQTFNTHLEGPRYMQMTKSATRRTKYHRRSISGMLETPFRSAIPAPGKFVKTSGSEVKENKPARSLAQRKWISSTTIGQRSTFL